MIFMTLSVMSLYSVMMGTDSLDNKGGSWKVYSSCY